MKERPPPWDMPTTAVARPVAIDEGKIWGQAPRLTVRLRADIRDFLLGHAEGAHGLIERLVEQERQGTGRIQSLEKRLAELQEQADRGPERRGASQPKNSCQTREFPAPGPLEKLCGAFS